MTTPHPDDRFHPPTSDDPFWTETCWFTFAVPERRLSGQLYPFFRPNQGVTSGGAFFWDPSGSQIWNCVYAKNLWHLPIPKDQDLTDIRLANGIHYRCLEPLRRYEIHYLDADAQEVEVHLTFDAICDAELPGPRPSRPARALSRHDPHRERDHPRRFLRHARPLLGRSLPDRRRTPSRVAHETRWLHLRVDVRPRRLAHDHRRLRQRLCLDPRLPAARRRLGQARRRARREVLERKDHCPTRVRITGRDTLGRTLEAEGRTLNKIGVHLNPNLWTWNCLTDWQWDGGKRGFGEDHDNWSASAFRHFARGES